MYEESIVDPVVLSVEIDMAELETANPATVATAPVKQAAASTFRKFAGENDANANRWGIRNNRGEIVTTGYLRRYIQCWCRIEHGYTENRAANFAYFMSDEFMADQIGKTASKVGQAASLDPRWGDKVKREVKPARRARPVATETTRAQKPVIEEPAVDEQLGTVQPATDAPDAPLVRVVPMGVGSRSKSHRKQVEEAELAAIKSSAIAALKESLEQ